MTFTRKWAPLIVLSLALAIIIIDSTLLNVSLSTLIRELHTTLQKLQWVISAYSLVLAALTVTGGRMGDLFGRKRMFMTGAVIFVVGAVIASVSHSFAVLLWGESIIEGIGAALMMPSTAALLLGVAILIVFGIWEWRMEARGGTPIVSMHLFENSEFVAGAGVIGVLMLAQNGVIFSLPVFLQSVKQLDALHTGLTLLPMSLMLLIVSPTAARLTKRFPHKRLVQTGLLINVVAIVV